VWLLAWFGTFAGTATLSAGSRLFYYGVICASLPALRRKQKTPAIFHLPGGTLMAILGVLICATLLTRIEYNKSILLLIAVAVAFLNWCRQEIVAREDLLQRRREKRSMKAAPFQQCFQLDAPAISFAMLHPCNHAMVRATATGLVARGRPQ
jgi:amino acid transporter